MNRRTGTYVSVTTGGEEVNAFIPRPLPVVDPSLDKEKIWRRIDAAEHALEHLEIASQVVPSVLDTTKPTASAAVQTLVEAKVLKETTGKRRSRFFAYAEYLKKLAAETEL